MSRVTPGAPGNFSSGGEGGSGGDVNLTQVGGSSFSLGQQLAAASLPIVLTASQLSTLTPPAAITGFATSAKQDTIIGHVDGIEATLTTIDGRVDGIESLLTTIEGDTSAIQTAIQIMDDWDNGASDGASMSGDVAHDSPDAGEPVKVGGLAVDIGANGTDVSAADRTNAKFLRSGQQLTLGGHQNIISKNLNITDADGAQTDTALVTVSAGTAIIVTKLSVMADGANTGDVAVRIGFGTANVPAADSAGIILAHPGIKSGSGVIEGNGGGIVGMGASNEDLRLTCEDPAGGAIDVIVTYFTITIG